MTYIIFYSSIILFSISLFYFALCIFKVKDYRTEKMLNQSYSKLNNRKSIFDKLRKKLSLYIEKHNCLGCICKIKIIKK